jgi:non-specific serine/threonine protein kinase
VGKTRLALAVAAACARLFADGVAFVPLAALGEPALLAATLAHAVGAAGEGGRRPEEALAAQLGVRRVLLVLDNLEHLLPATPLLADLLATCPHLAILATSRALLQVRGERALPVPPLPLPAASPPPLEELAVVPAMALFVERAQAVRPEFALTAENAEAAAAICRRLEGLPLALELAAARIRLLPPRALLARLERERRLPTLMGGARDLPERHQTLRAALAWSYDLLPASEQALFRRFSVFAGGATLEAATTICPDYRAPDALEGLEALLDHSLLRPQGEVADEPRLGMLETLREFAGDLLTASGEREATEWAHAAYYLALAEAAEPELRGPHQAFWVGRLEAEVDNMRSALRWAREHAAMAVNAPAPPWPPSADGNLVGNGAIVGLRLAAALWRFWWEHGYLGEGRTWLEDFLAAEEAHAPRARETEASSGLRARALSGAGILAAEQADYEWATARLEESLALRRALGDTRGGAEVLNTLGTIARDQGDYVHATELLGESLEILQAVGDSQSVAATLSSLGEVARYRGDLDRAMALHDESFTMLRTLGDKQSIATSLYNRGLVAHDRGDHRRALALHQESLTLFHVLGDTVGVAWSLEGLAAVIGVLGQPERAARLFGTASALRSALGAPLPPAAQAGHDRTLTAVRASVAADTFDAAWAEGTAFSPEQAIAAALAPA